MKKNSIFFIFFLQFFLGFLDTLHTFFCIFGPKITYFYVLGGQHVHLTPKKYPDISEHVQGRVNNPNVLVEVIDDGSEGNQKGKTKRQRCKKCPACQTPVCGICPECKDKIKFGGRGKLKKGCR